jgi:hypothetical protein
MSSIPAFDAMDSDIGPDNQSLLSLDNPTSVDGALQAEKSGYF